MRKRMIQFAAFVVIAPCVCLRAGSAQLGPQTGSQLGQQTSPFPGNSRSQQPTLPSIDGQSDKDRETDPTAATREAQQRRSFATERQKKMVQDTDRLLTLATELKHYMDKTTKDEMSLDVIKKADEIERLAHDVKTRMKG